jgi:hypothetical protein
MTSRTNYSLTEIEKVPDSYWAKAGGETCIYIYGVGRCDGSCVPALPPVEGILPGVPVMLFPVRERVAIVSPVPLSAFASGAVPEGSDDVGWANEMAVAHHRVLVSLAPMFTLAPLKFGSVCRSPADLIQLLTAHSGPFDCALDRVDGAREWGVKLHCDMETRRRALSENAPSLAPLRAELAASSPGRAFFVRKKLSESASAEARKSLASHVANVHNQLSAEAREAAVGRIQPTRMERGSRSVIPIFNASYLVDKRREAHFHQALADMGEWLTSEGLAAAVTGPWPSYNFVSFAPEPPGHE